MICSVFGQLNMTKDIKPALKAALTELIIRRGADCFYIGGKTAFDKAVWEVLAELAESYPIVRKLVTAGLPVPSSKLPAAECDPEAFSDNAATAFMIESCDTAVVCFNSDCPAKERIVRAAMERGKEIKDIGGYTI